MQNAELLQAAISGYEKQLETIDAKIAEIRQKLNSEARNASSHAVPSETVPQRPRRRMSSAARRKIAAAQRKRWRNFHSLQRDPAQKALDWVRNAA